MSDENEINEGLLEIIKKQFNQISAERLFQDLQNFLSSESIVKNTKFLDKNIGILNLVACIGVFELLNRMDMLKNKYDILENQVSEKTDKIFERIQYFNTSIKNYLKIFQKGSKSANEINSSLDNIMNRIEKFHDKIENEYERFQADIESKFLPHQTKIEEKLKTLEFNFQKLDSQLVSINETIQMVTTDLAPRINVISEQFNTGFDNLFHDSVDIIHKIQQNSKNLGDDIEELKSNLNQYSELHLKTLRNKIEGETLSDLKITYEELQSNFKEYKSLVDASSNNINLLLKESNTLKEIITKVSNKFT